LFVSEIELTIDGKKVVVPKGTTILQAARKIGVIVPTLCYDEEITSFHCCRICMVEVEGEGQLVASCSTAAVPGMVVNTNSPDVVEARRTILELLLANHPHDCLVCDKAGSCKLQNYAYWYGVDANRFSGKRKQSSIDNSSAFIYRDPSKCILCGKCVRVCEEVVGKNVIDFAWRGFETRVTPPLEAPLADTDCIQCGNCIAVCPVGALTEKSLRGKGRSWEISKVTTVCPYCGAGCTVDLNVRFGKVLGATSNENGEVNGRFLCVKGRFGYDFIHHKDRITSPYIRKRGKLTRVSWAEAIHHAADMLGSIKMRYGGQALGVVSSARCTNEENYLAGKFARTVLGTNNIDHCARLCHAPSVVGLGKAFGSGAMTNSLEEIPGTDFILAIGTNTPESHPVIALKMRKAIQNGATLAVIDPRRTELAEQAHYHAQIVPGTDVALLNAMANVIIREGLWDREFVEERTENFLEFRRSIRECSPEWAHYITGVPVKTIIDMAISFAKAPTGMIFYTMGVTQHAYGTQNVLAIANLAMLTGKIGREHCGVCPLRGQNNVQGSCDMGALPDVLPGYQKLDEFSVREKFEKAWACSLPTHKGLTLGEMFEAAQRGDIKGMYIIGENPVISEANAGQVYFALQSLEFLVVQDIFMSETARLADVVFPASSFAEKDGTFTNTERRVQLVRKAIEPLRGSKPDWIIFCQLASAMGHRWDYASPEEIMREIASVTPIYGGIKYSRLEKGGLQWPCYHTDHPGTKFLHKHEFTRGKGKFHAVPYTSPGEETDGKYPYILITGRRLFHYHTGTMTRKVQGLNSLLPNETLQVNPSDARNLDLNEDDRVRVISRRGR